MTRARLDIVFPRKRVAVSVDARFRHACPEHGTIPVSSRDWWETKLAANVERDRRHDRELTQAGWTVIRVWEHEEPQVVADRIEHQVRGSRR